MTVDLVNLCRHNTRKTTSRMSKTRLIAFTILLLSPLILTIKEEKKNSEINLVTIIEMSGEDSKSLEKILEKRISTKIKLIPVSYSEEQDFNCYENMCNYIKNGVSAILDMSWKGWSQAENLATSIGIPYIRIDVTNRLFVQAADDYLQNRNASDAALIFSSEAELNQALLYLIGNSIIRMLVLDNINTSIANNLKEMRPMPSNYIIYGTSAEIRMMFETAYDSFLVTRESKWTLVFENFAPFEFDRKTNGTLSKILPDPTLCCYLLSMSPSSPKECKCESKKILELFVELVAQLLADTVDRVIRFENGINSVEAECKEIEEKKQPSPSKENIERFYNHLEKAIDQNNYQLQLKDKILSLKYSANIEATSADITEKMGTWTTKDRFILDISQKDKVIKRFLKIGIAIARPFTFKDEHENGTSFYDGFCIRLLQKIAEIMNFEYEYVLPPNNLYGTKHENGSWDGLIGDLVNGVTDIVIAALTMTSEREEAVDFVAPHFDQSGISIVMRKPEREVSLFKFMSVLEPEVWWCILAAIIVTALVLWLLDKYSPFSGQNKKRYPYECRKFTLVECFWFALTSITPQGGGEPPKAVSGRILVAAYWLFVVLMLATFTANLAAFLTVERMQTPVRSLEELAKQSKINYTVVKDSSIEQYFVNMAGAEDELYRVWKDITLNTSNDQAKYRVWDYPIKEQYNRILNVIKKTGMMKTADEGFEKVKQDKESTFAFIHDAAEIKYEVYRSCELTEIGEAFAEQPYAIAVQSGSYLQEEISKVLLDLQKDRYFEQLYNIFWNSSVKRLCPNSDETEGITLQSLGGVFIATLVGLAIGMLTLVGEVMYYKKKRSTPIQPMDSSVEKLSKSSRATKDNGRMRTINVRPRIPHERY